MIKKIVLSLRILPIVLLIAILLLSGCGLAPKPLPHSLYYLDDANEVLQIWRLERNGSTRTQLTFETTGVNDYSVSPVDGTLAYISENRLYLADKDGQNKQLLVDANLLNIGGEDAVFRNTVSSPSFSPDGATLAYALDGIHLYDLRSGNDEQVLTNMGNLLDVSFVFSKEVYTPGAWSPDGSMFIIIMSYYEGYTLAVMNPSESQPFTRLVTDGAVCCIFNWSEDSRSVLVANPNFTGILPGLWRYDTVTGAEEYLLEGHDSEGMINFVGWPYQTTEGEMYFFHSKVESFDPEEGISLRLVRSDLFGLDQEVLFEDAFQVRDALWAPGGDLVVVSGRQDDMTNQLILLNTEIKEVLILLKDGERIGNLAWGP
jgi:WD40 repeat protein